jgi:hypothetical protein
MKRTNLLLTAIAAVALLTTGATADHHGKALKQGDVALESVGPITFGPDGLLFVSDPKAATIYAVATADKKAGKGFDIKNVDQKIAALLGTSPDQIIIVDMAVNPASKNAYLAVSRGRSADAQAVIVKAAAGGKLSTVSLKGVKMAKAKLPDPPADRIVRRGRRSSNPRTSSITDMSFTDGRVIIAGLANEEFASTLRAIPFPFNKVDKGTTVEIFHGAHGKLETHSPIRTFVPFNTGKETSLLAAYTCTPLVEFPVSSLKPAAKITGRTIAELGNRNRPIDMIVYHQGGKDYLLIANSSRGIMKVTTDKIATIKGINSRISGTAGTKYETIKGWQGIDQLDKFSDQLAIVVRKTDNGSNLETLPLP